MIISRRRGLCEAGRRIINPYFSAFDDIDDVSGPVAASYARIRILRRSTASERRAAAPAQLDRPLGVPDGERIVFLSYRQEDQSTAGKNVVH
jgi:hypothetical protein